MNKISYPDREKVYKEAIETFGVNTQLTVAMEEMAELQKEICKEQRGFAYPAAIAEELADATIMLEQLRIIFDNNQCVCNYMDSKIKRLMERIEDAKRN